MLLDRVTTTPVSPISMRASFAAAIVVIVVNAAATGPSKPVEPTSRLCAAPVSRDVSVSRRSTVVPLEKFTSCARAGDPAVARLVARALFVVDESAATICTFAAPAVIGDPKVMVTPPTVADVAVVATVTSFDPSAIFI